MKLRHLMAAIWLEGAYQFILDGYPSRETAWQLIAPRFFKTFKA
jgi:hypothetical protein